MLRVWLVLGLQSFGGGMATLALIRRTAVDEERWLTETEFTRFWSLVQLAPGINLLALTILIGRKTAGVQGIALALAGLLLPSVAITVLLTAGYAHVQHQFWVQSALSGIVPAVVGLGLMTAGQIALPSLRQSWRAGGGRFALSLAILLGSVLAAWKTHLPVIAILSVAGIVFAAWNWKRHRKRAPTA